MLPVLDARAGKWRLEYTMWVFFIFWKSICALPSQSFMVISIHMDENGFRGYECAATKKYVRCLP